MATVLELEIAQEAGPATVEPRGARAHRADIQGKSALGQRTHPRRIAEARRRGQQSLDPALPLAAASTGGRPPALAHLPHTNQLRGIWAADLLMVQTVSYRLLYVFFLLRHDRREWLHFDVTTSPTAAWIWRQVVEATPLGRLPKFLIHDRDADYGGHFDERLANLGSGGCERH